VIGGGLADVVTLSGAWAGGTIDLGAGDADALTFAGGATLTVSNMETMTGSTQRR